MKAPPPCSRISHVPSYREFHDNYLKPNTPVVVGPALVESWPAMQDWVVLDDSCNGAGLEEHKETSSRRIDWGYLQSQYGHCEVTVADCEDVDEFGNQKRDLMLFSDVVRLWMKGEGQTLYVKDWHLARAVESECSARPFYTTPDIFRDDWMNAYYSAETDDDFRFVYVGAKGTFTPLHRDVYTSYSWSTNVCGRKRWWLFPPDQTTYLHAPGRNVVPYDVRSADASKFPNLCKACPLVIEQGDGETLFVPSGWYHQVENLTHCISINHNWSNSVNMPSLYKAMCDKVVEVEAALYDVRDMLSAGGADDTWKQEWVNIVQDVVKHDAGWNWLTFWKMVLHVLQENLPERTPPPTAGAHAPNNDQIAIDGSSISSSQSHEARRPDGSPTFILRRPLFRSAPASLMPSRTSIWESVRMCCEDFGKRDRLEGRGGVDSVVAAVRSTIDRL